MQMGGHTEDLVHVQTELATRQGLYSALEFWALRALVSSVSHTCPPIYNATK